VACFDGGGVATTDANVFCIAVSVLSPLCILLANREVLSVVLFVMLRLCSLPSILCGRELSELLTRTHSSKCSV